MLDFLAGGGGGAVQHLCRARCVLWPSIAVRGFSGELRVWSWVGDGC